MSAVERPPKNIAISVVGVKKRLGPNQALARVTSVFEAELLHGVIGPEGAGKTTLLRTLLGLLKVDEGEIVFTAGGQPVPFAKLRPSMAYMPQSQSLYPDLSIDEHLKFFRDLYQLSDAVFYKRREELLYITRLEPFTGRAAGQLSGGMVKKLGLMCALLQSPSVVLLDEPTNGVDPISRREFWDLLYRLANDKILVLVTTAYMDEAERCGKVHLLESGQLLMAGEPRTLLEQEKATSIEQLFLRVAAARSGYEKH